MFDYINAVWFVGLMSRSSAFSRPLSHRKAAATGMFNIVVAFKENKLTYGLFLAWKVLK